MNKQLLIPLIIVVIVVATAVATIFIVNSHEVDADSLPRETVIVERVYSKTEYDTKQISRRGFIRTNPHTVYYLTVRRPDGSRKSLRVSYHIYKVATKGDTALLPVGPGRLGLEVTDPKGLTIPHPQNPKRHHRPRCRYVGPKP